MNAERLLWASLGLTEPTGLYLGLDLGQARDASALVVNRKHLIVGGDEIVYAIVWAYRWPLGTPYPVIARQMRRLIDQLPVLPDAPRLFADATGVGRALIDLLRDEGLNPFGVTLTGGQTWSVDGRWISLPKEEMVSVMNIALQRRLVAISGQLPELAQLKKELGRYRTSRLTSGRMAFGAETESAHDDMVIALGLSMFGASKRWGAPRSFVL